VKLGREPAGQKQMARKAERVSQRRLILKHDYENFMIAKSRFRARVFSPWQ